MKNAPWQTALRVSEGTAGRRHAGAERGTRVWGGTAPDRWPRHLSRRTLWRTCVRVRAHVCASVSVFPRAYAMAVMMLIPKKKKLGSVSRSLCWIKIRPHVGDSCNQPVSESVIHCLINHDLLHSRDSLKHTHAPQRGEYHCKMNRPVSTEARRQTGGASSAYDFQVVFPWVQF